MNALGCSYVPIFHKVTPFICQVEGLLYPRKKLKVGPRVCLTQIVSGFFFLCGDSMGLRIIYRLLRVVIQRAEVCSALDTQADLCLGVTRKHALILIRGWVSPFIAPLFIRHTHLQRVVDKEKFEGHLYFCSVIHQPRSGSNVHRLL